MLSTMSMAWVKQDQPATPVHFTIWTTYYADGQRGSAPGVGVGSFDTNLTIEQAKQLVSELTQAIEDAQTRKLVAVAE